MTAWAPSSWPTRCSSRPTANFAIMTQGRKFLAWATILSWCTQ
jgi:hypothetical protein